LFLVEMRAIDRADARHHAIGGRRADEIVDRPPPPLRRDGERAIFDEAPLVAEIGDVLARRALIGLAPPRHRVGPRLVLTEEKPLAHGLKIGPDAIEIERL